jgi:hypothetical protein
MLPVIGQLTPSYSGHYRTSVTINKTPPHYIVVLEEFFIGNEGEMPGKPLEDGVQKMV